MRDGKHGSDFEHGVSVGSSGDVRQRTSGGNHEIELILDEVREGLHSVVAPTDANKLHDCVENWRLDAFL